MILEQLELRKIRPSDYLKEGFFDHTGDWIEGLNSVCSLATAHHLHAEGTDPDQVKKIADQFMDLSVDVFGDAEMIEYQLIDEWSREAILEIMESPEVRKSVVLTELFDTIRPHLNNWKNFAALVIHLQRISSQLSQVSSS
ncbi:MAG TPA: hypothetical protein VLH08_10005 [Acidobacteriota bacterium]|jgi:hypothetical protein|nr:hypothetical protein [Acidobacteriota bacterium]